MQSFMKTPASNSHCVMPTFIKDLIETTQRSALNYIVAMAVLLRTTHWMEENLRGNAELSLGSLPTGIPCKKQTSILFILFLVFHKDGWNTMLNPCWLKKIRVFTGTMLARNIEHAQLFRKTVKILALPLANDSFLDTFFIFLVLSILTCKLLTP